MLHNNKKKTKTKNDDKIYSRRYHNKNIIVQSNDGPNTAMSLKKKIKIDETPRSGETPWLDVVQGWPDGSFKLATNSVRIRRVILYLDKDNATRVKLC